MVTSGPITDVWSGIWAVLAVVMTVLPLILVGLVVVWIRRIERNTAETARLLGEVIARQERLEQNSRVAT